MKLTKSTCEYLLFKMHAIEHGRMNYELGAKLCEKRGPVRGVSRKYILGESIPNRGCGGNAP